jgi:predicted MPP superfamily phosphohydrolase
MIITVLVYGFLNYHIGSWNLKYIKGFNIRLNNVVYWIIFGFLSISFILSEITERLIPGRLSNILTIVGSYWMGVFFYSIIIFLFIDTIRIINKSFNFITYSQTQGQMMVSIVGTIILLLLIALLAYGTWNARNPVVREYNITVPKSAGKVNKLNIVMISDIHLGSIISNERLEKMVDDINSLKPDAVFIAGDIIDSNIGPFLKENMGDTLRKIHAPLGVYASPGNHDYMGGNLDTLVESLNKAGIRMLADETLRVGDSFYVVGRNDASGSRYSGQPRKDINELLAGVDKDLPIILLDHQPIELDKAEASGADIQFSGHTHRGQLYPNQFITGRIFELDWGYLKKGRLNAIVSAGIGTWGPPIRIGSRSEIVNVKVNFSE